MSNTVITNYTDLNGPSTKAESSVVVIVNKDGSLSVDQKLLGTLMGSDGSQSAGISVVRVGHEGRPDDATDSETDDDKIPHVTLSVDSYYDEPNSIIKYDSGAEMLQSLKIETRENSLLGFQNDHCYTSLTPPTQALPQKTETQTAFDDPIIEITQAPPPKPLPNSKKITVLEQHIIPQGKKIVINPKEATIVKGRDVLKKSLPTVPKSKKMAISEDNNESSSASSSGDSIPDRDSDSDYKDVKDKPNIFRVRKTKLKPRILKGGQIGVRGSKMDSKPPKVLANKIPKIKNSKSIIKKQVKERVHHKNILEKKPPETIQTESTVSPVSGSVNNEVTKVVAKTPKPNKKEKKTPARVTALLSDMTSLFSTPDVIRRVSTENKLQTKGDKDLSNKKHGETGTGKFGEGSDKKTQEHYKSFENTNADKSKNTILKTYSKHKDRNVNDKNSKGYDLIPQLDDASLAQILQDTSGSNIVRSQHSVSTPNALNSPNLAGPLSPTLDLLGGLHPEEEGLTEDLLMHVAQLVESSENLQEVIDKQVLGKLDQQINKTIGQSPGQQSQQTIVYEQTSSKMLKTIPPRKDPIEIVRRDGRVITLPPIEAPATRSKRRSQVEPTSNVDVTPQPAPMNSVVHPVDITPEPQISPLIVSPTVSKQYVNKKLTNKKQEQNMQHLTLDKIFAESQESWNSEDDPTRLWCICRQPHNNRFMISCDECEDWFHGKCVNITKAMGQQMEDQNVEWRCPNCIKKVKPTQIKSTTQVDKVAPTQRKVDNETHEESPKIANKAGQATTNCIVCKKPARSSSIYCSDVCILKHAQDSLGPQSTKTDVDPGKPVEKIKAESRVIVYERKSGRLLAGPNAPTADNLKSWLQKNPTFEVVRPGTLSTVKPNTLGKKSTSEPNKIQTTLNFERIPKKPAVTPLSLKPQQVDMKESPNKIPTPTKEIVKPSDNQPRTPITSKSQPPQYVDTPRPSTSTTGTFKSISDAKKPVRASTSRSYSNVEKAPSVSPAASRNKDNDSKTKMNSGEPVRENVKKALQEQMGIRMSENKGDKFTEDEIKQFAIETELELYELFKDVGMKYKAKYRSLMFNIKDRKNLTLWEKICDRTITPKQLVRLSPEELASQELAEWRDNEAKHQLELIKKSELDLLAANKTYVLKTHKGEEVMETKKSVSTELDPNVPVEDLVTVLNVKAGVDPTTESQQENPSTPTPVTSKSETSKRNKKDHTRSHSKRNERDSKRDFEGRKGSTRRKLQVADKEEKVLRSSEKRSKRTRTKSNDIPKVENSKEKSDSSERSRRRRSRSRSRDKSKKRSNSPDDSKSVSQSKERSRSRERSRRHSRSKEKERHRRRSRSKHRSSTEEKHKHRSKSQDNIHSKGKNDSTDSDSIERPKSAMLKESHPEYDPHEPMITSAFSEEDLRKSREDVYEDSYRDISEYDDKHFSIDSNKLLPNIRSDKGERVSETESDQEPSSTVDNAGAIVWNGCINMVDVARFYVAAHEVSGSASDLEEDLGMELDIVGRINPDTVWEYTNKMKRIGNNIIILRLQAANDEEMMQYIALYSYLNSRNRLGVVKVSKTTTVKDFYIVPLPVNATLPATLLPFDGPGLGEIKTHLLLAIVIQLKKKRVGSQIDSEIVPNKIPRSRKQSYTPPLAGFTSYTPPTSPRPRTFLPVPAYSSPALSTSVKDKIAATLASADDEETYSPETSSSASSVAGPISLSSDSLRSKMEELNRQIEEQKQQIRKIAQADSSVDEDEAYSPSRPMTPPAAMDSLADISLPSNLQEILATIKQKTEPSTDVNLRN